MTVMVEEVELFYREDCDLDVVSCVCSHLGIKFAKLMDPAMSCDIRLEDRTATQPQTVCYKNAIIRHLLEKYTSDLYGGMSISQKAQADSWLEWVSDELSSLASQKDAYRTNGEMCVAKVDLHLRSREFLVGDRFSIADMNLCISLMVLALSKGDFQFLGHYKSIDRWFRNCLQSPALMESLLELLERYGKQAQMAEKSGTPGFQELVGKHEKLEFMLKFKDFPVAAEEAGKSSSPSGRNPGFPTVSSTGIAGGSLGGLTAIAEENPGGDAEKEARKAEKKAKKEREKAEKEARKKAEEERKKGIRVVAPEYVLSKNFPEEGMKNYGKIFIQSQSRTTRKWIKFAQIDADKEGQEYWIRCRIQNSRIQGKKAFLILRNERSVMQCIVEPGDINDESSDPNMGKEVVAFCRDLPNESVVDIQGVISIPPSPVQSEACTIKNFELQLRRIYCISRAEELPFQLADASRAPGTEGVHVAQDTRLNNRVVDLRTLANQGILRIQSAVCEYFREFLTKRGFTEIHSPKLLAGGSEGGAEVFEVKYFPSYNNPKAFLAQSPQLYKQMALMTDLTGVFEIAPVFRAEDSFTHRHMTEFVGLDMEMHFKEHYHEVLDVLDECFNFIFKRLEVRQAQEIEAVGRQYPAERFLSSSPCKRFTFKEAIDLLRTEGFKVAESHVAEMNKKIEFLKKNGGNAEELTRLFDVCGKAMEHKAGIMQHQYTEDLSTKDEKILGEVIRKKYKTDFYIIDKFPMEIRPFYTMPDPDDPEFSNSYDIFCIL